MSKISKRMLRMTSRVKSEVMFTQQKEMFLRRHHCHCERLKTDSNFNQKRRQSESYKENIAYNNKYNYKNNYAQIRNRINPNW
jgi:hypothetical protein